ncbi:MAG: cytochrome c oxidase subunit II [Nisaea sp.]|jgi:cytochrome c oxidase subunit 2|uniref:cytochrome c oxidase subunit II n=1 Tax=Nisaea sp. TaxID=2024842 RepID=UPI001B040842|nr:cytochrome c oxidase subunit II [Nisaea sp.]MBO6562906.1 cytochrome c oxidase subunit II [Nisaea sp.]
MRLFNRAISSLAHLAALPLLLVATLALPAGAEEIRMPQPYQLGLQDPVSPVGVHINEFHTYLLYLIFAISIFVLALLVYVCIRYRASANPNPSRTSHNTLIEILWTAVPVIILVVVAIPSFKNLYYLDRAVDPDMTIKVIGNQWYWSYEYPDEQIVFDSYLLEGEDLQKANGTRLLDVDNPLVVPTGKKIQVLVTSNDVFHSFFVPSAVVQIYAIGGRTNETWMQFDKEGTFYGQCNQICGVRHAYMPIVVKALNEADYAEWLKGAKEKFAMNSDAPVRVAVNAN